MTGSSWKEGKELPNVTFVGSPHLKSGGGVCNVVIVYISHGLAILGGGWSDHPDALYSSGHRLQGSGQAGYWFGLVKTTGKMKQWASSKS